MHPDREAGFSLGANLGDALARLREARRLLARHPGVIEMAASSVYETSPVEVPDEYAGIRFLNSVLILRGPLTPEDWHALAHATEAALGRVRDGRRHAPRPIDIDLLYCGSERRDDPELQLPHPRWSRRRFVLAPLAEVRPGLVLPGAGGSVRELLAALQSDEIVLKTPMIW